MTQTSEHGNDIGLLLQAAEYLEKKDKRTLEREHGYATPIVCIGSESFRTKIKPTRRNQNSRTTHNELEKNRRAQLRRCLENLKSVVPLHPDATRHTTLSLLKQACSVIKSLEEENQKYYREKNEQFKRNAMLTLRLIQLEKSRYRRNSTGSSWSSGLSESSNDSDKDDENIDVTDLNDKPGLLKSVIPVHHSKLITISVPKPISLPAFKSNTARITAKVIKTSPL